MQVGQCGFISSYDLAERGGLLFICSHESNRIERSGRNNSYDSYFVVRVKNGFELYSSTDRVKCYQKATGQYLIERGAARLFRQHPHMLVTNVHLNADFTSQEITSMLEKQNEICD